MPSLRPRLMLLSSTELMDMLGMLLPLTPMNMLHMLDTPMLLDMLVPMDTVLMVDTHTLMVHIPPMVLIPTMDKKKTFFTVLRIITIASRKPQQDKKQYDCHQG